jgi:coiled-coil domain-containing protein 12
MDNAERAKRLKALREKRNRKENEAGGAAEAHEEEVVAVPSKEINKIEENNTVTEGVAELAAVAAVPIENEDEEEEVLAIAPKKPTWDLDRGLEKQMKKLERRTQNAIVHILREKMERQLQEDESDDTEENDEEVE